MEYIIASAIVSAIVAVLVAKSVADHHFKVIDGYVRDVVEFSKDEIGKAYGENQRHTQ